MINDGVLWTQLINQRRQRRQRNVDRTHRRGVQEVINNEDTLNRIGNLPTQIVSDPLIHGFFNGSSFI